MNHQFKKMSFNPLDLAIEELEFYRKLGATPKGWLIGTAALIELNLQFNSTDNYFFSELVAASAFASGSISRLLGFPVLGIANLPFQVKLVVDDAQ